MALNMTKTTARMALAVSLSAIIASCSTGQAPSAFAVAPEAKQSSRFGTDDLVQADNRLVPSAVPRVYLDEELIGEDAPDVYEVVRGDTLWDISDRFLKEPWLWTEIWSYNPQVYDPHLIYPGDVLALEYINGKPTLSLTRNGKAIPHSAGGQAAGEPGLGAATPVNSNAASSTRIRISPQVRSETLDSAIPTISGDSISSFLVHPKVVDAAAIAKAPYVIANSDDRLISSIGSQIYARGTLNRNETVYGVFRKNKPLIDPVNGALLGYEMMHVSDAKLLNIGDPSTLGLTSNKMETIAGDVLFPMNSDTATHVYVPRMPELRGEARIVSLVDAIAQTGRNQVVVLNVGADSSIQEGDILAVETRGKEAVDKTRSNNWDYVQLPNQRTGVLMVFKTFDKVSYALVMESTRPLKINDIITGI